MLLGFIFFHETPSLSELMGSILIFLAVVTAMSSGGKSFSFGQKKQI
jgi:drug/metabolite transporter (DMT)-like permease